MANASNSLPQKRKYQMQTLLAGGVAGALLGVGAAYLLMQARDRHLRITGEETPLLSGGDAVKLGVLSFGLLRQIADMASRDRSLPK
jgi:hypothetical protein